MPMRRWGIAAVVFGAFVLALVGPGSTQRAASATKAHAAGKFTITVAAAVGSCDVACDFSSTWFKANSGDLRCTKGGVFFSGCIPATAKYPAGAVVKLTAGADKPLKFRAWSGDCSGSGSCTLVMDSDKTVGVVYST